MTAWSAKAARIRRILDEHEAGPEIRGLWPEDVDGALAHPRTVSFPFHHGDETIAWPLLVPIECHTDYRGDFLAQRFAGRAVFFLQASPDLLSNPAAADALARAQGDLAACGAAVVVEERAEDIDGLAALLDPLVKPQGEDRFIDPKNHSEAAYTHFAAPLDTTADCRTSAHVGLVQAFARAVADGDLEATPTEGTAIYRLEDLESLRVPAGPTYLERLLEIYETQFDELVSAHPGCQAQTRDQLLEMFADDSTAIVVHTVDGDPAAATIFVERIGACIWLRERFYETAFPGERVVYFPGIVTDPARKGRVYSVPMTRFLVDIGQRAQARHRFVFQCTNVSEDYVPLLVGRFAGAASGQRVEVRSSGGTPTEPFSCSRMRRADEAEGWVGDRPGQPSVFCRLKTAGGIALREAARGPRQSGCFS